MLGRTRLKRRFFLDGLLWLFLLEFGIMVMSLEPGFLDFDNLPDTNFTCVGKVIGGYYADLETNCQMFHVCTIGQENEPMDIRFLCLNGTVFDQETRVCERIDEVDCSKSEQFYSLNLELYGNTQPAIQEESPDDSETERPPPRSTTSTTTRPSTTKYNKRPPFYTTSSPPIGTTASHPQLGKGAPHHFSAVSSDIRFNPEEINISLNAGAPPDIRTKHHQPYQPPFTVNSHSQDHSQNMFSDNRYNSNNSPFTSDNVNSKHNNMNNNPTIYSDNSNLKVTSHSSQYSDLGKVQIDHEDSTTQTSKSLFTIDHNSAKLHENSANIHGTHLDLDQLLSRGKFADPSDVKYKYSNTEYRTEYPQVFRFNNPDNYKPSQSFLPQIAEDVFRNKQATITYHPPQSQTTVRTIYLETLPPSSQYHQQQTEKPPQRVQIPIPVLPTFPPLTFSSPAPFSLNRHIDSKRYTKDHPSPPRIIISASASVTDDSGRRLNYSLGTIGAAHILDSPPASYDDYKDADVGLDPFYHDVQKVHHRRKRNVEFDENTHIFDNKNAENPKPAKLNFENFEMLKDPKQLEELLKFFGTIKDEEDLDRLLTKRSADPQQPSKNGKINVFDIIRNEKEAVEVLKFLFTWYKSHQVTATAPPITIPVSPEIISKINYEFAPKDTVSDGSELRYLTKIKLSSTAAPVLITPKNIPVMYLDYLDGIKIEAKSPTAQNNEIIYKTNEEKQKLNQNNFVLEKNNNAKPFSVNHKDVIDVNDYVNDNYEPEVLKYWGKQNEDTLQKDIAYSETSSKPFKESTIEQNNFLIPKETSTSVNINFQHSAKEIPYQEQENTDHELKSVENLLTNETATLSTILLPPKESISQLAKEVLVYNHYLTSSENPRDAFSTVPNEPLLNLDQPESSSVKTSDNETNQIEFNHGLVEFSTDFPESNRSQQSTSTTTQKSTSTRRRYSNRHRNQYHEDRRQLNNLLQRNEDKQTSTTTKKNLTTSTSKYKRIKTTRPSRSRSRFGIRKSTTAAPARTTTSKLTENYETGNTGKYDMSRFNKGLPLSNLEEHLSTSTSTETNEVFNQNHTFEKSHFPLNFNLPGFKSNFESQQNNETLYTEYPISIEIQPPFESYEIQKLNNISDAKDQTTTTEEIKEKQPFQLITEVYDYENKTTPDYILPIYYKDKNHIESPKQIIKTLEFNVEESTTEFNQKTTVQTNQTDGRLEITITNIPMDDTTATTPVVSYLIEDVIATTSVVTEPSILDESNTFETTTRNNYIKTRRPRLKGKGKNRFSMHIQDNSIKNQLSNELEIKENSTTTTQSTETKIESTSSPNLLSLDDYIYATTTETATPNSFEIISSEHLTDRNFGIKEHISKTKIEIVGSSTDIKNLLKKEKKDNETEESVTDKYVSQINNKKRGRLKFLDHYSTTTPENIDSEDLNEYKIKSVEIPNIPYKGLKIDQENVAEYTTVKFRSIPKTTLHYNSVGHDSKTDESIKNDQTDLPPVFPEENTTEQNILYRDHVNDDRFDKLTTVPQILKYLISEIHTTEKYPITSLPKESTSKPENFFLKISHIEEENTEPVLMDTSSEPSTTEALFETRVLTAVAQVLNQEEKISTNASFEQQMLDLKNSSHLVQVVVENSTPYSETTLPVTSTASSTVSTTTRYYTRSARPTGGRQFGRHRFSTELITRNPIDADVTKNEIESNDKITDAPLHKSVPPTLEVRKSSTTSQWRRSFERSSKRVNNFTFNCFGKELNTFYSDPRDCRLFHYCTQGYSKNQLLDLKYVCDLETYFDDEKVICTKNKPQRCL